MSKRMPIISGDRKYLNGGFDSVPFEFLSEERATQFHSQTLDRLAERGGMGIMEILYNVNTITQADLMEGVPSEIMPLMAILLRYSLAFWSRGIVIDDLQTELDEAEMLLSQITKQAKQ